ncbi:hypothetical protein BGW38_000425 [Lunasporangiospora selenospora]|uniref:Uncharacterized protein n=1 Tax=Lunasporangiospora selenospora TaxID=979761 RepID=A0A9P6FVN6_9FUNG|nr:hypothetical protein BGW38_000425 [Lunasporangiospora selenospora]
MNASQPPSSWGGPAPPPPGPMLTGSQQQQQSMNPPTHPHQPQHSMPAQRAFRDALSKELPAGLMVSKIESEATYYEPMPAEVQVPVKRDEIKCAKLLAGLDEFLKETQAVATITASATEATDSNSSIETEPHPTIAVESKDASASTATETTKATNGPEKTLALEGWQPGFLDAFFKNEDGPMKTRRHRHFGRRTGGSMSPSQSPLPHKSRAHHRGDAESDDFGDNYRDKKRDDDEGGARGKMDRIAAEGGDHVGMDLIDIVAGAAVEEEATIAVNGIAARLHPFRARALDREAVGAVERMGDTLVLGADRDLGLAHGLDLDPDPGLDPGPDPYPGHDPGVTRFLESMGGMVAIVVLVVIVAEGVEA